MRTRLTLEAPAVWDSLEPIRQFAGEDIKSAVVPAVVRGMMVSFDAWVRHYELVQ